MEAGNVRLSELDPREMANEHWRWFYRGLVESFGGEWRRFGAVDAFSTPHLPAAFANGLLAIEPAEVDDVLEAIEWVSTPDVRYAVRIDEALGDELLGAPVAAGLVRDDWDFPGMMLSPIPTAPAPPTGVVAERVVASNYEDFIQATVDTGFPRDVALQSFNLDATGDGYLDFFVARLDGRPAATATLVRTDDVAGIYAVATVEGARRRGLGAAVTWAAVDRAREWGAKAVILQSTQMGLHVYESIGFKPVVNYAMFMPAQPPRIF